MGEVIKKKYKSGRKPSIDKVEYRYAVRVNEKWRYKKRMLSKDDILFKWSCRESNPGPNKLAISFLHA